MPYTQTQIEARGRLELLMDDIKATSRERNNLLRPLRERIHRALPVDSPPTAVARGFDFQAAGEVLAAARRAGERLDALIEDYNALAPLAGQRPLPWGG
jgi:hypothetical protein